MQRGAAEKWSGGTKKWASRLGGSGAKEIDEADFAVVLVGDRIALAPIAQQAVGAVVQMDVAARATRAGGGGGCGGGGEKVELVVRGGVA